MYLLSNCIFFPVTVMEYCVPLCSLWLKGKRSFWTPQMQSILLDVEISLRRRKSHCGLSNEHTEQTVNTARICGSAATDGPVISPLNQTTSLIDTKKPRTRRTVTAPSSVFKANVIQHYCCYNTTWRYQNKAMFSQEECCCCSTQDMLFVYPLTPSF